jgi:hypothetical protein
MPQIDVQFRATPAQALEFVTKLARDDAFREKVAANPVAMLAAYNIHIVPAGAGGTLAAEAEGAPEAPAQRTEAFGEWAPRYKDRVQSLEKAGFQHQGFLPPKHVVEEALVNVRHSNEFGPPKTDFGGIDPFGFWLLFPLTVA